MEVTKISIADYDYPLPEHRIAQYPLPERDASKLLVLKGTVLREDVFRNLGTHLPSGSLLVTNKSKVVNARLHFYKPGGAHIELFCLEPVQHNGDFSKVFVASSPVVWRCLVGNSKRWKSGILETKISHPNIVLTIRAERLAWHEDHSVIMFSWDQEEVNFGQILEWAGELPLPPYMHRKAEDLDYERYQTIFATAGGSVAAPTAGLHFTTGLTKKLEALGHQFAELTLHVGAGTFKPVSAETIGEHQMHAERVIISRGLIESLLRHRGHVVAVGTTSMRTLESIYWLGIKLNKDMTPRDLFVDQWMPYANIAGTLSREECLQVILNYMDKHGMEQISAQTALMIAPGYRFQLVNGLITNFHQPKSTLLLLVSAFVGPAWKEVYDYALRNNFRFLSYGDSCLFIP
ncbi:MAG: S-adenosylmethionine:tRNA ribosyltransferase-isomerase [Bacteroidetes bacterium]|nr:S-adenosylmethionine:tRNA ribosyltransferase-isomerase [Bacteroidota bacterium]